ncbi:TatD family hydrolase [Coralloluteibacterium stylophorae]|uniref:TatD family hydrolase n=1 Tax=Coralloluteibacterium stylophorae TaxID=1776034 RepID=A0A8J7VW11_9GAMM|nr:TatD family hydrolase [Coralloluteibacterium stylophorae]MBS7455834.1 TatD family hydrolase [Coralloluteibacterium stylophorae]
MLVDTHSHLDMPAFDADRDEVLARARTADVLRHVLAATHHDAWPRLRTVCAAHAGLHPAYGLHPVFLPRHRRGHLASLREWLERERPVAVGECGLDFHVEGLSHDEQLVYFDAQLRLARDLDLPVIVHARRALDAVIQAVRRVGGLSGVVHSFSGSPEQARRLYAQGFMLGIGGPVTYERAQRLRRTVAAMPIEHLLLETDAPDQPDSLWRGRRNEPARLGAVLAVVAGLRGAPEDAIAAATTANALRLFRLPSSPTPA